jgi:hypothetical protein
MTEVIGFALFKKLVTSVVSQFEKSPSSYPLPSRARVSRKGPFLYFPLSLEGRG